LCTLCMVIYGPSLYCHPRYTAIGAMSQGWRYSEVWLYYVFFWGSQFISYYNGLGRDGRGDIGVLFKVTLEFWVILEVALLTVWSDWPPSVTLASDARCYRFRQWYCMGHRERATYYRRDSACMIQCTFWMSELEHIVVWLFWLIWWIRKVSFA
jgi:hypothetical protein